MRVVVVTGVVLVTALGMTLGASAATAADEAKDAARAEERVQDRVDGEPIVAPGPQPVPVPEPEPESGGTYFRLTQFRRGDTNTDGTVDISDALRTFSTLFLGARPFPCLNAADSNRDLQIDVSDGVFTLNFLFLGGPTPEVPGPHACGVDRAARALPCVSYDHCPDDFPLISHVLNRITFGPTLELYSRIQTKADLLAYIDSQLDAPQPYDQSIDEPALHATIEAFNLAHDQPGGAAAKIAGLNASLLVDATQSDWQLLQVVTQFWNNHFHTQVDALRNNFFSRNRRGGGAIISNLAMYEAANTDPTDAITETEWNAFRTLHPGAIPWLGFNRLQLDGLITLEEFLQRRVVGYWKYAQGPQQAGISVTMERREYDLYRRLAFGSFRDLLEACAKSVAMLIYLNTFENTVVAPNENYSREYFELQALGVDHVYTQRDIEELSKIFTGWIAGWVERALYDPSDINFQGHPEARSYPIDLRENPPFRFPTQQFWDDATYAWGFVFQPGTDDRPRHDWSRKDLFLQRYGGVDSLGNPLPPTVAVSIPDNVDDRTVSAAMREFEVVLDRTVNFRDCAKFISSKLIQLFVTDDLLLLKKTYPMPEELAQQFNAADYDANGSIEFWEWEQPIPLVLPNGKPPEIFARLDSNLDGRVEPIEFQEPDLLLDAIDAWRKSEGEMREVIRAILHSEEFLSLKFQRAKIKTPLEAVTSAVRILDGTMNANQLRQATVDINLAGMELYRFADPTGESELGFDWMHTVGLLERLKFLNRGAKPTSNGERRFQWTFVPAVLTWGIGSAADAVDYYQWLIHAGELLPQHTQLATEASGDAIDVPGIVAFLLSLPQFQQQ